MEITLKQLLASVVQMVFPDPCWLCRGPKTSAERFICSSCWINLPRAKNDVHMQMKFQGLVTVKNTYAFLKFHKGNAVQKLLHMVKYQGQWKLGYQLGCWFGVELRQHLQLSPQAEAFDMVVPVPLHYSKLRRRGFNQSYHIALGIAHTLNSSINNCLYRALPSYSQTALDRWQRFENTQGQFAVKKGVVLKDCSVLLVDDVVTTGATLTACAHTLNDMGAIVSMAAIALAQTT